MRSWPDDYLHELAGTNHPYHSAVIKSELRVREAWRSPASPALVIALFALAVSIVALIARS